ncbi:MAG: agmatine deiminase family protein [Gammaproteobacteria bacterium]|nr:agmatine deiminase family protein [Gammaproteobacteria bacterium]
MLTWPHDRSDWQPILDQVEPVFVSIAKSISQHQKVVINCFNKTQQSYINDLLRLAEIDSTSIIFTLNPSNDTWVRDYGPITIYRNNHPYLLDFTFNAWGHKFESEKDNKITRLQHKSGTFGHTPIETVDLVLEGGSIETDGQGTLLTTEACLLAPNRNPHLNRSKLEHILCEKLGIQRILWLKNGYLAGDDTDSHIDTLARFCDAQTICYVACDDVHDEHYKEFKAMEEELKSFKTVRGKPYRLMPLPWPKAKYSDDGQRLPATYANFLIINGAVLLPTYNDPADEAALACLQLCFPNRKIIPIPCQAIILQYGSLHCLTMQLPDGVL